MKKKKKKVYNTPKKQKHQNKISNILQFIKSFSNLKCNMCQSILAKHFDRNYCGKCKMSQKITSK